MEEEQTLTESYILSDGRRCHIHNVPSIIHERYGKVYDGKIAFDLALIHDHMNTYDITDFDFNEWKNIRRAKDE